MFDMLASKLGEAQAFADGLAVNLDVMNMDRLLEEQEREEKSKAESLRLLRNTGDTTTDAPPGQASSEAGAAEPAERVEMGDTSNRGSGGALGEIEIPQLRTDAEQEELKQERGRLFSPDGAASEGGGFSDSFAAMEDGGGNFEDEFDPILASIRKPPQRQQPVRTAAATAAATAANTSPPPAGGGGELKQDCVSSPAHDAGRPSAGSTFAAGFLSILPGDMRAKAGEVMAQSSARISESADAIRSALETGRVAAPAAADKFKRRQSDGGGNPDLEDGRGGGKGGGRRAAGGGEGDDDEVRLLNVNELLSEEERQQLASFSGGAGGGAGRFCGWRRLRKYIPVVVGIGLLGLFYLWRWGALLGDNTTGVVTLGSERV